MSTQRLSRKEIKHDVREDAFRHGVEASYEYVKGHRRPLLLTIVGVIALVLAISLTAITLAFFVFVMIRSRLARDAKERVSKEAAPPSPRPAASGGSLGRH